MIDSSENHFLRHAYDLTALDQRKDGKIQTIILKRFLTRKLGYFGPDIVESI